MINASAGIAKRGLTGKATQHILSELRRGCKVVVLTGAGVSCASGIPDFRSPGGMYDTLKPELITATEQQRALMRRDPTAVVDIRLFSVNQFPYLEVRRPFILGTAKQQWKATLSHFFIQVLHDKGLLQRLYSQNIDGLDFQLSLPADKIINMHGSLGEIKCEFCGTEHPIEQFHEDVRTKIKDIYAREGQTVDPLAPAESSNILCISCGRAGVKPATVMYGCNLPRKVHQSMREDFPANAELLIVAGTSLTVHPACDLVTKVDRNIPRLLVNRDPVGRELGLQYAEGDDTEKDDGNTDAFLQGDCDSGFLALVVELGWVQDIYKYKERMCEASAMMLEEAVRDSAL